MAYHDDIYAQRLSATGVAQWTANGVAVCTLPSGQVRPTIAADGVGGAVVAWQDDRNLSLDIFAQRMSAAGAKLWTADGVAISTSTDDQYQPVGLDQGTNIVAAGTGGAIIAWEDYGADDPEGDIYAQYVRPDGQLGGNVVGVVGRVPSSLTLDSVWPNPSRGERLTVHFTLGNREPAALELHDVAGRCLALQSVGGSGLGSAAIEPRQRLAPGLYFLSLRQGGATRVARVVVLE